PGTGTCSWTRCTRRQRSPREPRAPRRQRRHGSARRPRPPRRRGAEPASRQLSRLRELAREAGAQASGLTPSQQSTRTNRKLLLRFEAEHKAMPRIELIPQAQPDGTIVLRVVPVGILERLRRLLRGHY